jgi:hypothetical protein
MEIHLFLGFTESEKMAAFIELRFGNLLPEFELVVA